MKKVLLTGASGFIGRNLNEYLKDYYNVFSPGRKELDLLKSESVREYLQKEKFDVVIHSANMNDVVYQCTPYDVLDRNLRMFYNLESCSDLYGKMYYFGSGAEYDMDHYIPMMNEDYFGTYIPHDPYGFSKYTMSRIAEHCRNVYDLRLFSVYGKYEEWKRRFISNNLCKLIKGRPMTINKNVYFDFMHVADLCKIMRWFIENEPKHRHYNVCTSMPIDLYSVAGLINECTGSDCEIQIFEEGWKPEYSGDNSRLLNEMGGFEFEPMKDAITALYQYWKDNQDIFTFDDEGQV